MRRKLEALKVQISQAEIRMSLDLYTRNIPLTQKAKFWGNYVSALKGEYCGFCL